MEDLITIRLNEASIAQALAKHYSDIGDHDSASFASHAMQERLSDADQLVEFEMFPTLPDITNMIENVIDELHFDIDIVEV